MAIGENERHCVLFSKYRPLVDNEHVGQTRSQRVGARRCLYYMFIGDKVVSFSFQVFYCDINES